MAKKQKTIDYDVIKKEIDNLKNEKVDETQLILDAIDEENCKHFSFYMDRKDVGLNILNHWNLGYLNSKSIKWIENIIKLVNDSSNGMIIASNLFTPINASSPQDCISYEKQIALACKILSNVRKPVLLWQGKNERDIFKLTGEDVMELLHNHLKRHKNIHLIEELADAKNENDATILISIHLKTDFVKDPIITLELRDYKTVARNVKSAENRIKKLAHVKKADFIIDLAVLQNAKVFPNLLCVGPVCDEQFEKNIKKTEISLNDSYFKLEIQKNSQKNGQKNNRGYTPIALKYDYSFDNKEQIGHDRINITANSIAENLLEIENEVFYEIMQYFAEKKDENYLSRHRDLQEVLSKNKQKNNKNKKTKSRKIEKTRKTQTNKEQDNKENQENFIKEA